LDASAKEGSVPRKIANAMALALAVAAFSAGCSSSSSGPTVVDASVVDAETQVESDGAADANEEEAAISPVDTCSEAQLAFATNMACGQCVATSCAKLLNACTNCILCQQQLGTGCPACASMCFGGGGMRVTAADSGP
jgi:hypothetical protein